VVLLPCSHSRVAIDWGVLSWPEICKDPQDEERSSGCAMEGCVDGTVCRFARPKPNVYQIADQPSRLDLRVNATALYNGAYICSSDRFCVTSMTIASRPRSCAQPAGGRIA
jgi:hypothetical protein